MYLVEKCIAFRMYSIKNYFSYLLREILKYLTKDDENLLLSWAYSNPCRIIEHGPIQTPFKTV